MGTGKGGQVEHGSVGTPLISGILDVEFNPDLKFPQSIAVYDQMRKGDSPVGAALKAIKTPLLSGKHSIKPASKDPRDVEIAEFIRYAMFKNLRGGYKKFYREALTSLEMGFKYFEKIFRFDKDGKIVWDRFAPRDQKSHYLWGFNDGSGKADETGFVDGHPPGITQQLPGADDDKDRASQVEIPWSKLLLFVNDQEGNNYEGVSILRPAYKNWYYKDLLFKIQSISAERFGVGIPVAKHPKNLSTAAKAELDKLLKNIRSNEKSYARVEDGVELSILTPTGDPKANAISDAIREHKRDIYESVLAGFLNLTSGEGGSNALSEDQSSFFLRAIRSYSDTISEVLNDAIKELVDMNYSDVDEYPTHEITDLGDISLDEYVNSISTAKEKGLVNYTAEDEVHVREVIRMPERSVDEIEEAKAEHEKKEKEEAATQEAKAKAEAAALQKGDDEKAAAKADAESKNAKKDEPKSTLAEDIVRMIAGKKSKKKEIKVLKDAPKPKPKPREKEFTKNITEYEDFLESKYSELDDILSGAEDKYRRALIQVYESADHERKDGVMVFARTPKNTKLVKMASEAIAAITKQLEGKLIDSPKQRVLFDGTVKAATANIKQNEKFFQEIVVDEAQFQSFVSGYISNTKGVLFNEPRRIEEQVVLNFGSQISVDLAVRQAGQLKFNRNVFKLSTITHARSLYTSIVFDQSVKDGFTFFKTLVPKNKLSDVSSSGMTAGFLFTIMTAAQINKAASKQTEEKNSGAVQGLGLHHGSYEYYYPIASDELDEEEEIAAQQKKDFEEMNKSG
jgi:hypothetical protein